MVKPSFCSSDGLQMRNCQDMGCSWEIPLGYTCPEVFRAAMARVEGSVK